MHFRYNTVAIESLEYALPDEVWTSDSIEERLGEVYERLGLPAGRLELMTGIRERRFWAADHKPSAASAAAGAAALEKSSVGRDGIELLIHCGVCRDRLEPATASYVHGLLDLPKTVQVMDLSNACLGFCNALSLAGAMLESGQIKAALIVSGENGRPLMDWSLNELARPEQTRQSIKAYFANLTIGAGAVAAVLTRTERAPRGIRLAGGVVLTDSAANALCEGGDAGTAGLAMQTDSEALLKAGVALARSTWQQFVDVFQWSVDKLDCVVCHQVGRQHQRALLEALEIPLDKDVPTYPELGNIGSVSLPLTLARAVESGHLGPGGRAIGLGIGSGLSCMMLAFERSAIVEL